MLINMLQFEWRYFTRQPSFIVTCLVFFLLPYMAMVVDQIQIGAGGNVTKNSPFAISQVLIIMSIFAMFMVVNFVGNTAIRNNAQGMSEIVGTKPIRPLAYNLGRFLGAYLVCVTVFSMVPIGTWLGTVMPWVDSERLGANSPSFYLIPFTIFSVTTLFTLAAIFYVVARKTNTMTMVYVVAIVLFIAYNFSAVLLDQPDQRALAALADPFGFNTFNEQSRYWTIIEQNTQTPELNSTLLQNRTLWLVFSMLVLLMGGGFFKAQQPQVKKASKKELQRAARSNEAAPLNANYKFKAVTTSANAQFLTRVKFEVKQTFSSPGFLILMGVSILQIVLVVMTQEGGYGQPSWPITANMVDNITGAFGLQVLIVLAYFTGETIWRERESDIGDITDSTPTHNFIFWSSKFVAISLIFIVLMIIGIVCGVVLQTIKGHTNYELGQYLVRLFYFDQGAYELILTAALAFLLQALSPSKYIGILLIAVFIIARLVISNLGLEHTMFNYPNSPNQIFSDLNGYGDAAKSRHWYMLYWSALALVMCVLSYGMWQRGPVSTLRERIRLVRYQIGGKGMMTIGLSLAVFVGSGAYIHYNTRVLNQFVGVDDFRDLQAEYEKEYAQYKNDNNPFIIAVDADIAIYPEQRRIEASAQIEVQNRGNKPIKRFLVSMPRFANNADLVIGSGKIVERIDSMRSAWFEFEQPLASGEKRTGTITSVIDHDGFKDRGEDFSVLKNGTFINNGELFPTFGYNFGGELLDRHERRKRGLPEPDRAHDLEDTSRYHEHFFSREMTFIDFKATVSTSNDHIAMVPGYLTKEWEDKGRRFFRYEMDAPMLNFFSITSGRYDVAKEDYKGVSIEVYYHPTHDWNVDRMIESTKDSLDYFQTEFGPYQHRQYRIIEFPRYRGFAQSFANTIPFSEAFWLNDQRSSDDIDVVYFVNAHEMAHQWWGHQLGAANVQGAAVLSESLAEYSALVLMEKTLGETKARHFLTYELDRYLQGRTSEILEELPLLRVENQAYIHYQKGSVVLMSIRHKIGEERLHKAIRALLDEFKYKTRPYPTTLDLVRHLKTDASAEEQAFIDDHFERITVFDMRAEDADVEAMPDGKFKITLTASAVKYDANGQGVETELPLEEWVEVAAFNGNPNEFSADTELIYKGKYKVVSGSNTLEIIIDKEATHIGIDPFIRYIDRDTGNNILTL